MRTLIKKTLKDIQSLIGGRGLDEKYYSRLIEAVSTDSRQISRGNLFFPLVGDNFNGHDFIGPAIENGAGAIISSQVLDLDFPVIYVDDTLQALQDLAKAYIEEVNPFVIGVTGSNGKTSTKDILASIFKEKYKTHKTQGNFNNLIGLPLTILSMEDDVEFAILEMGIDHFGEMDRLSKIARPNLGIITNAGEAHLDDLGSKENVAKAKMEFLINMKENPRYFYFKDDENLDKLSLQVPKGIDVFSFGLSPASDFRLELVSISKDGSTFRLPDLYKDDFFLPLIGKHQVYNAGAAVAVANCLGLDEATIRQGLKNVEPTGMRNELKSNSRLTILDDSYKSNPSSLLAALETIYSMDDYGQRIAIIGDMLGIGDDIENMHREVGRLIREDKIDYIIGIGYYSEYIIWEAEPRFGRDRLFHFEEKPSPETIKGLVSKIAKENPLILVKASRPLELDTIVGDLLED